MKLLFFSSIFFIAFAGGGKGQDSLLQINNKWQKLTDEMKRRYDLASTLFYEVNKLKPSDSSSLASIKASFSELVISIDSIKNVDSSAVQHIYGKNLVFVRNMSRLLALLAQYPESKQKASIMNLQMQLEAVENRLALAKKNYNQMCTSYNRRDLFFGTRTE